MSTLLRALPCGLFLLLATGCEDMNFGDMSRFHEEFRFNYPLQPGGRLFIENMNGPVEIRSWERSEVEISGTKNASTKALLDSTRIDVTHSTDSVRIRTVAPSDFHGGAGARYAIRVPRQTRLERVTTSNGGVRVEQIDGTAELRSSNGPIRVMDLKGDLNAETSNGSIELSGITGGVTASTTNGPVRAESAQGPFDAKTSNGSITARLTDTDSKQRVRCESSNGSVDLTLTNPKIPDLRVSTTNSSIRLRLPGSVQARLRAETSHSSITSDFTVAGADSSEKHRLEGAINGGGPLIDLSTSNGSIRINKS